MKIKGKVVINKKKGTSLGFPTANLKVKKGLNLENGVYLGKVDLNDKEYNVLVIIGIREEVEVWFNNFRGNLYDLILEVEVGEKINEIEKLDNEQKLIKKIESDIKKAKSIWQIN